MGKKSSSGNNYRNPVDSYRKQLGKNEERKYTMAPRSRGNKSRPLSGRELARARSASKNWSSIVKYVVLLLALIGVLYLLAVLEAGRVVQSLIASFVGQPPSSSQGSDTENIRVHRDAF